MLLNSQNPHVLFISSSSAWHGNAGQASYSASKAGLIGLARSLAREWAAQNIKVNVVFPGFMKSRQTLSLGPELANTFRQKNLLGRFSTLAELSRFIQLITTTQGISAQLFQLDSRI
jgi:3-oxoacyl-[acyl-carrier protein] reductase